jgi:hypothetical protein
LIRGYEMTFYESLIANSTGLSDIEKIRKVESYMRHIYFHSTLDWQELDALAIAAKESAAELCSIKWEFR